MTENHCENNLEIFGTWEILKQFYNENWSQNALSFKKIGDYDDPEVINWDKGLFESKKDSLNYIFLTKEEPPRQWLKKIAEKYKTLDFTLDYQNREKMMSGQITYKNGEIFYNEEELL